MPARIDLSVPKRLLADYQAGRATADKLARRLGVSPATLLRRLEALGVDTSMRSRKRQQFARRLEAANGLAEGRAYPAVARLYRRGLGFNRIAAEFRINNRTAALILARAGGKARPVWYRSVFRAPDGRPLDARPFARKLRALRESLGLTQKQLAERCGFCQATIWHLETGRNGPHWQTLFRLTEALGVRPKDLGVTWRPPPGVRPKRGTGPGSSSAR
jgi:DNA-binding XRE family transcriptional regulator/transposase-like protein